MRKRNKTILTVSHDRSLQHTRTLILEEAGFTVWEATNQAEALTIMGDSTEIEMVVICHSVPEESRRSLTDAIKKEYPSVPVLMLCQSWESRPTYVDASVNVSEAPPASWLGMVGLMTNLHSAPADRSYAPVENEKYLEMADLRQRSEELIEWSMELRDQAAQLQQLVQDIEGSLSALFSTGVSK